MDTTAYEAAEQRLLARYGVRAQTRWVELREPRMRVRLLEAGEGEPVLFIHGGGGEAVDWAPLLARLEGVRAIAVDRPGCGLSDGFSYSGVDLRSHGVSFIESLLDAIGLDDAPVVGNSMGGLWALWAALAIPQRIRSLALLGCPALMLDTGAPLFMHLAATPLGDRLMLGQPSRTTARRILADLGEAEGVVPDEMVELTLTRPADTRASFLSLIRNCISPFGRRLSFSEHEARRVLQPTLFIWGDGDPFGKVSSGRCAAHIMPAARIEVVHGGHLPWLDEPERCARLIAAHSGIAAAAMA